MSFSFSITGSSSSRAALAGIEPRPKMSVPVDPAVHPHAILTVQPVQIPAKEPTSAKQLAKPASSSPVSKPQRISTVSSMRLEEPHSGANSLCGLDPWSNLTNVATDNSFRLRTLRDIPIIPSPTAIPISVALASGKPNSEAIGCSVMPEVTVKEKSWPGMIFGQ